jgi:RNA polymerase sigma factor (sigma-70 family)
MPEGTLPADRFEEHRERLRRVAYRLLGSMAEAEDAVQEAWIRVNRADSSEVGNLGGWLTTIVARVALNMLRARRTRREEPYEGHLPDPVVILDGQLQPEEEALMADSVGLALLVVLDTLGPAERLAFVLHDVFQLPFNEIAPMIGRTPAGARQLASRARRRVQGAELAAPDPDRGRQRAVVDAFFTAARGGDLQALMSLLDPDVVLRADFGARHADRSGVIRGAAAVAGSALSGAAIPGSSLIPALVNGAVGAVVVVGAQPFVVMGFVVAESGRIVEIDAIAGASRIRRIAAPVLERAGAAQVKA